MDIILVIVMLGIWDQSRCISARQLVSQWGVTCVKRTGLLEVRISSWVANCSLERNWIGWLKPGRNEKGSNYTLPHNEVVGYIGFTPSICLSVHPAFGVRSVTPTFLEGFLSCNQAAVWMVQSVRMSIHPSHLFDYVPIIVSAWNFQELWTMTEVTSLQNVKVRGQISRSQG